MKKKTKYIAGGCAFIIVTLVSISLFSTNQQVKRMNEKMLRFFMSLQDTSWTNPKGRFLAARIVYIDEYSKDKDRRVLFTVPADKMEQFEKGYRDAIRTADNPYGWDIFMQKEYWLEITTEKKTYKAYLRWTDEKVCLENGMRSKDLRKVFFDAGLGYPQ